MRFGNDKTNELLENVRREMVMNPSITIFEIQDALQEKYRRVFDKNFIARLKNKIHRERTGRVHNTIGYEIAMFEDTCIELKRPLWEIIDDEGSSTHDKISAIRGIRTISNDFLDVMFNAGFLTQQIGVVMEEKPLSNEQMELMEQAISWVNTYPHEEEAEKSEG